MDTKARTILPMTDSNNPEMVHRLRAGDKEVVLVGTAHVSRESVALVKAVIEAEKPDTVAVELCPSRFQAMRQEEQWREMDIVRVIREKKAFLLLSSLLLAAFQRRIAAKLEVKPGAEMIQAVESAEAMGASVHLADRDVRTTLSRTWRAMGLRSRVRMIVELIVSMGEADKIDESQVEAMKQQDVLESLLSEIGKSMPELREILIDERDRYLTEKIRSAPGEKIVAVVGAGHVPGIRKHWERPVDLAALEQLPPKRRWTSILKWGLPLAVLVLIGSGFFFGGRHVGTNMIYWWVAANGILAALGALIAFAHPLTVLSSALAAPLTSLNPMIAAGWVSGLVEAIARKPRVKDFESLPEDILSLRGFWRNKVTKVLLVVVLTNLGSAFGTMVALPLMVKVF